MQTTLKKPVTVSGVGLHTGCDVTLELGPAPAGTGYVFRRTDLQCFEIEAVRQRVSRVVLATTLMKKGVMLSTVEHVLSALYGLGLDNVYLDIDSLEVPILDGSAGMFVKMVQESGIVEQAEERTFLRVEQPLRIEHGEKWISVDPWPSFRISYEIDFTHPAIGHQNLEMEVTPDSYVAEISFARTFGFYSEVEDLLKKGLIRGGSLDNAVVLSEQGILNGGLRAPDEFVRHKVLDLIGDISLCGFPLLGHIRAYKAGHALHAELATRLYRTPGLARKVRESDLAEYSEAVNS